MPAKNTRALSTRYKRYLPFILTATSVLLLSACSSDDDDDSTGYIKFYNASSNSPAVFLTIDEDLDNDDEDEFEQTFSSISFGRTGSRIQLDTQDYFYELAWQNEDSSARGDLEILAEDSIRIENEITHWLIMSGSAVSPEVTVLPIPNLSDEQLEQDAEDDVVNLRFVNLHSSVDNIDAYLSLNDETFNEARLITSLTPTTLSDNYRIDQDQYKLYVTLAGSQEVLFTSDEINYAFGGQYLLSIRDNIGAGGSPFVVDNISNSTIEQFDALESTANLTIYSGLGENELLSDFAENIDVQIQGPSDIDDIDGLAYGEFSDNYTLESGDYRFTIKNSGNDNVLLQNRVLSIPKNNSKTLFLYWTDEAVDDDNDGIIDENEDGIIDEVRAVVSSLVVDNSQLLRLYDKQITMLNLTNTDEFGLVTFYFVTADEIIDTTDTQRNVIAGNATSLVLRNNTYQVFAIAEIDGNEIILDELSLTLDESSPDLFLLLEHDVQNSSGFSIQVADQRYIDNE